MKKPQLEFLGKQNVSTSPNLRSPTSDLGRGISSPSSPFSKYISCNPFKREEKIKERHSQESSYITQIFPFTIQSHSGKNRESIFFQQAAFGEVLIFREKSYSHDSDRAAAQIRRAFTRRTRTQSDATWCTRCRSGRTCCPGGCSVPRRSRCRAAHDPSR